MEYDGDTGLEIEIEYLNGLNGEKKKLFKYKNI